ncbi:EAL domain-containing protein [Aliikangiella marina]|uniref:EAL domain-containing protein n=1 Tax=Aliikangiella marina TaxID=1712262 RepID=A0A545T563_9GAMM|nr:EAL domain-containing protein [Aliikangiella marina]TQV72312.1 EAL domain-containing protein [Aliikangiella marina]
MHEINSDSPSAKYTQSEFEKVLKNLLHSTAGRLEEDFLQGIAKELSASLGLDAVLITEANPEGSALVSTVVVYSGDEVHENFDIHAPQTLIERVLENQIVVVKKDLPIAFPEDNVLIESGAQACIALPLKDSNERVIGALIALSLKSFENTDLTSSVLQLFAFRIASELERQRINAILRNEVVINQTQLDSVPALMFMVDMKGKFLRWNQYFVSKFGYSLEQMERESLFMVVHKTDHKRIELELKAILEEGFGSVFLNGVTIEGELVPMLATAESTVYKGEKVIVGVALDMTEQQSVERNLLRSQGRLARKNSQLSLINALVEKLHASHSVKHIAEEVVALLHTIQISSSIGFSVLDESGQNLVVTASSNISDNFIKARGTFPLKESGSPTSLAVASQRLELFPDVCNDSRIDQAIRDIFAKEGIWGLVVLPLIYKQEILGSISIGYKPDAHLPPDELEFYQTICSSIALALSNAKQYQRLESLATKDNLTQLPNRNAFNQDCPAALERIKLSDRHVGVVLVDLDRFKEINDTLDHQIGDKLLKLIGPRLSAVIKDPDSQIYRLGGDEFLLLIGNKADAQQVVNIAQKVEQLIAQPFVVDGLNLEISSSIGVATTHGAAQSSSEMLRCAELAMYRAKSDGGGTVLYSPELDANTNQRFVIMAEMAEAIRNDDLVLHFQPKFDLRTNQIIGSEALVRWQHKRYGLLPPAKFIPQVELTQLINPLTFWVMKTAMIQLQSWKKQGISVTMAINLSTRNLTDEGFIEQVDRLMEQYHIEPNELEFEVTETALMNNLEQAKQQLSKFSERGIQCALDDYGTGYSSLTYIKKLPLDTLKIDRSFISQMLEDKDDHIIAKSTINLAHSLGLQVIAEGVEDEKTLQALADQGCDFIQGYHISEPIDGESFSKLYWQRQG